jgi:hypothetical protein
MRDLVLSVATLTPLLSSSGLDLKSCRHWLLLLVLLALLSLLLASLPLLLVGDSGQLAVDVQFAPCNYQFI